MRSISNWLCSSSSKSLFVKIVHHGGHQELYDRPIPAAEVLSRHPKSCMAHPTVFQNPYAIVSPSTNLALGHKYYIVPISTVRRLQLKYIASKNQQANNIQFPDDQKQKTCKKDSDHEEMVPACWSMKKNKGQKLKKGKIVGFEKKTFSIRNRGGQDSSRPRNGRTRFSSFDHWQPGLESITEE